MIKSLSHSSMELYKECPQRFKFRYVDGIKEGPKHYFSYGQSVHKAMEFFYRSQLIPPGLEEVLTYYKTYWVKGGYTSPEQERQHFLDGQKIITGFYKKHIHEWKPPLATEYDFSIDMDGIAIRGKIDRVDKLPSGNLHVIDYKTGKAFSSDKPTRDVQLTLYQFACESSFGASVDRLTLYHLPTLTPMDSPRHSDAQVKELRRGVLSVKTSIDNQIFDPKPQDWKCSRCDYKKICPAWGAPSLRSMEPDSIKEPTVPRMTQEPAFFKGDEYLRSTPDSFLSRKQVSAGNPVTSKVRQAETSGLEIADTLSSASQNPFSAMRFPKASDLTAQLDELIQKVEELDTALRRFRVNLNGNSSGD